MNLWSFLTTWHNVYYRFVTQDQNLQALPYFILSCIIIIIIIIIIKCVVILFFLLKWYVRINLNVQK